MIDVQAKSIPSNGLTRVPEGGACDENVTPEQDGSK
jgi:hypothetical protein